MTKNDLEQLERLVDGTSLGEVLAELATIAFEKAEHVRTTWCDPETARLWAKAGNRLTGFLGKIDV